MINSVKARTPILALILFVFAVGSATAQNKVVVIPMAADEAQWALVRPDGTIAAQSGGITVNRNSAGTYLVDFGRDVTGHAINVSARWPSARTTLAVGICGGSGGGLEEQIFCGPPQFENSHNVAVVAYDSTSARADSYFYLSIQP